MIKIIGIGNRVMGDDGIALKVLDSIEKTLKQLNKQVQVIIGETDFMYCLSKINDNDTVIIVDSTWLGLKPGNVTLFSIDQVNRYTKYITSQHQISLVNMIANYKNFIKAYVIGIEVYDVDFSQSISNELGNIFSDICNDVLSKIQIVLKTIETGE